MATRRPVIRRRVGVSKKRAEISGMKELSAKFKDHIEASANQGQRNEIAKYLNDGIHEIAESIKQDVISNGRKSKVPEKALEGVFKFYDPSKAKSNSKRNALVGINKKPSMVEWTAAPGNKSKNKKVKPGGKVAMSIAAMIELGTTRMRARPYFGPAIQKARGEIAVKFAALIKDTMEKVKV